MGHCGPNGGQGYICGLRRGEKEFINHTTVHNCRWSNIKPLIPAPIKLPEIERTQDSTCSNTGCVSQHSRAGAEQYSQADAEASGLVGDAKHGPTLPMLHHLSFSHKLPSLLVELCEDHCCHHEHHEAS